MSRTSLSACSEWGSRASGEIVTPAEVHVAARLVSSIRVLAVMAPQLSCDASTMASAGIARCHVIDETTKKSATVASATSSFFPESTILELTCISALTPQSLAPQSSLSNRAIEPTVPATTFGSQCSRWASEPPRRIACDASVLVIKGVPSRCRPMLSINRHG